MNSKYLLRCTLLLAHLLPCRAKYSRLVQLTDYDTDAPLDMRAARSFTLDMQEEGSSSRGCLPGLQAKRKSKPSWTRNPEANRINEAEVEELNFFVDRMYSSRTSCKSFLRGEAGDKNDPKPPATIEKFYKENILAQELINQFNKDVGKEETETSPDLNRLINDVLTQMADLAAEKQALVYVQAKILTYAKALTHITYSAKIEDQKQKELMNANIKAISRKWSTRFGSHSHDITCMDLINSLPYVFDFSASLSKKFPYIDR
ncbi:hypothetical protein PtA15_10A161 [Puccinia triticina]|uniref:Uncharacterized protein n=1 Tax=Puccinia triticina TaxID=208348 RepID=A0ABY7CXL5_9BASI|nr:uncharacterized protein PtA15_10A161 [Puccinia triticina]WAQ88742.1 hypothetical protein PtA15_10A161 [Puccinia triticina]